MRLVSATLAILVAAASTPAAAQPCDCGPAAFTVAGSPYVVVPRTTYVAHTRYAPETRLVPRTRYVPRTQLVPQTVKVPRTDYEARTSYSTYPAYPGPGHFVLGLPSLFDHPCYTGSIGCNPYLSGPLYDY